MAAPARQQQAPGVWAEKVADQVKSVIALMLQRRIKDPRLAGVSVIEVRVTGDCREATVFYSLLPGCDDAGAAAALESAKGMLRTKVGQKLGMKFVPTLTFARDAMPQTSREMEELLDRVRAQDDELAQHRVEGAYAGDADPYKTPAEPDETDEDEDEVGEPGEWLSVG